MVIFFAKLLAKAFRKPSIEMIEDNADNMAFLNECALLAHVHLYIILVFSKFSLTFGKFAKNWQIILFVLSLQIVVFLDTTCHNNPATTIHNNPKIQN